MGIVIYSTNQSLLILKVILEHGVTTYCKISNVYHANVFFKNVHLLISSYRSQNIARILDSISCSGKYLNKLFSSDQEVVNNKHTKYEEYGGLCTYVYDADDCCPCVFKLYYHWPQYVWVRYCDGLHRRHNKTISMFFLKIIFSLYLEKVNAAQTIQLKEINV